MLLFQTCVIKGDKTEDYVRLVLHLCMKTLNFSLVLEFNSASNYRSLSLNVRIVQKKTNLSQRVI